MTTAVIQISHIGAVQIRKSDCRNRTSPYKNSRCERNGRVCCSELCDVRTQRTNWAKECFSVIYSPDVRVPGASPDSSAIPHHLAPRSFVTQLYTRIRSHTPHQLFVCQHHGIRSLCCCCRSAAGWHRESPSRHDDRGTQLVWG